VDADDLIPMPIAAALAYGRLVRPAMPPSPRELNEQLGFMVTILTTAIPAQDRADGKVSVPVLFEVIERLQREAAVQSSEMMPR
jgi:hypothetical protein